MTKCANVAVDALLDVVLMEQCDGCSVETKRRRRWFGGDDVDDGDDGREG